MKFAKLLELKDGSQFLALYVYDRDENDHNVEYHFEFSDGVIKMTLVYEDEETALDVVDSITVEKAETLKNNIDKEFGL